MMGSGQSSESIKLPESEAAQIAAEVKQAAIDHLNAKDARTALSHFTESVIAVSNVKLFPSYGVLAEDVRAFYNILREVNLAIWDEMFIKVINIDAAFVTAKFRYSFTDTENQKTDLKGVWTALYVRRKSRWKIRVRHESFVSLDI
jgi:ketosteroid isomerase-like protein